MKNLNTNTFQTGRVNSNQGLWQYAMALFITLIIFNTSANGQEVFRGTAPVNPPAGGFGIDGDLRANTPTAGIGDWLPAPGSGGNVLSATGAPLDPTTTFHRVDLYNSGDNVFAGGQKKNDNPNFMSWINGNPSPAKNDINNLLMHIAEDPTTEDIWITVSGDRESTNGNSFISIALHQAILELTAGGGFSSGASNTTGGRTPGDIQVSAEFTGGGSNPNLYLEEWRNVGGVYQWVAFEFPAGAAYGATNASVLSGVPYDAFGSSSYTANAFIEVSFNISEIYRNTQTPCVGAISSAFVMTKSSQAVSANLTDFVDPIQINLDINVGMPIASGDDYCVGETIADLTVTGEDGAEFKWYTSLDADGKPTGTPVVGATYTPDINNTVAGEYNYYVTQSIRGCESPHRVVTVNVLANPSGTNTSQALCPTSIGGTTAVFNLTSKNNTVTGGAEGVSVEGWYDTYSGGVFSDAIGSPGEYTSADGNTVYAKLSGTGGCVGVAENALTVNPTPAGTNTTMESCPTTGGGTTAVFNLTSKNSTVVGSSGATVEAWYESYNSTTGVFSDLIDAPTTYSSATGNTVYAKLVGATANGGCVGVAENELTVNPSEQGPGVTYNAPDCFETHFSVTVNSPVAGVTYIIKNSIELVAGELNEESIEAEEGVAVIFMNRVPGTGYSVTATIGDCISEASTCEPPSAMIMKTESVQSLQSSGDEGKRLTAYPVPFYDDATVEFTAEQDGNYVVNLYDLKGVLIRELKSGIAKQGEMNRIEVDGRSLPEGMYLVRFVNGAGAKTVKLLKKQ